MDAHVPRRWIQCQACSLLLPCCMLRGAGSEEGGSMFGTQVVDGLPQALKPMLSIIDRAPLNDAV